MTTIVFNKGVLASDSSAVTGNSVTYITYHEKIRASKCKRFAYGVSGAVLDPDWLEEFEAQLFAYLIECRVKPMVRTFMPKPLKAIINKRDFIFMTKDEVYTKYLADDGEIYLTRLLEGEHVSIGTGRGYATVACLAGKTAVEAVEFAINHDYFTYPSKVLSVKQSSLKAFPKEVK